MNYDAYIAKWNGRQITRYGAECVAGVAEYEAENNRPIVWGDAHTWINNPTMLSVYDWVPNNPNDANQLPNRGDIIVWPLPNEHIAFYDHNVSHEYFVTFGQNSGGPTMHFQQNHWLHVAGWYTLKHAAPAPAPQPIVYPYTIEAITPKQVVVNKPTHRWGMNYDNFTAMNGNPVNDIEPKTPPEPFTVTAICHHNIGYKYYLPDANEPSGYNVLDCDDYIPPPPPLPTPPPEPKPVKLPEAPYTAPSSEQYEVIKTIPGYITSNRAVNHDKPSTDVGAGTYFVFNKFHDVINVTRTQGKPGSWINPQDNQPDPPAPSSFSPWEEPKPEPPKQPDWRTTFKPFRNKFGDVEVRYYYSMRPVSFIDHEGKLIGKTMPQYEVIGMAGRFTAPDSLAYLRPKTSADKYQWYGALEFDPVTGTPNLELHNEVFKEETTAVERKVLNTGKVSDKLAYLVEETFSDVWDVVRPLLVRKRK